MSSNPKALVELPRGTVIALLRSVSVSGETGVASLRTVGADAAETLSGILRDQLEGRDPSDLPLDEFWRELNLLFQRLGWGSLREENLHPGVVSLVSPDWFEADQNDQKHPCCHFSTGLLASLLQGLAGSEIASMEVECRAAGDPECRFLLGSPDALDELYERLALGGSFRDAVAALA